MIRKCNLPLFVIALSVLTATTGMAQAGAASGEEHSAPPAAAATPVPASTVDAEGKAIFEANCSSCHEITDATSQAKDLAGWTETVAKMVSYGAPVASEDQQRIVDYLAATYPAPRL